MTRIERKEALLKKLEMLPEKVQERVKAATLKGAEIIAQDARALAPVRSGKLKESIKARQDGFGAVVGSAEFYSRFVEFGTQNAPAHPFLFPALKINKKKVMAGVRRSVSVALKQLAKQ